VYEFKVDDEDKAIQEAQEYYKREHNEVVTDVVTEIGQVLELVYDLDQTGDAEDISSVKIVNRIFYNETVV
jgi:hypothetical protein